MKNTQLLLQLRSYNQVLLGVGLLLVASGIFAVLIVDTTNWWNLTLVVLGVALLGIFLTANMAEVKAAGKKRSTLARANLALVAAAVLGIVCGLNYVVSRHPIRFDLTSNKIYTLSDQTVDILEKLKQDVNVTLFTSAKRSSAEIQKAQQLLEEYGKKSTKFHFKVIDGDKNPTDAKRLGVHEYNTVVFEAGDNRKDVLQRDYVTYAMQGRQPMPKFQGEGAFTSALIKMNDTTHLTFYFTQGHGEKELTNPQPDGFNTFKDMVEKDNYTTKAVNLLMTGKIPEDAAVLAIIGPAKPFQPMEAELIGKYLKAGGKLILCADPMTTTGLDSILKEYGVRLGNDMVVDPTSYAYPDIRAVIPQYGSSPIVEKLSNSHIASIMPFTRSIQKTEPLLKNVTQMVFMQTTDKGWGVANLKEKKMEYHPGVDTKAPVPLAISCEWVPEGQADPNKKTRLVVYGNSSFLTNQFI
ncbi:MAG TPA: GldG family protein, partial [bacterium]